MCFASIWPVKLAQQFKCQLACLRSRLPNLACGQEVCLRGVLNHFLHIVKIRSSISTYQGGSVTCLLDNFCQRKSYQHMKVPNQGKTTIPDRVSRSVLDFGKARYLKQDIQPLRHLRFRGGRSSLRGRHHGKLRAFALTIVGNLWLSS